MQDGCKEFRMGSARRAAKIDAGVPAVGYKKGQIATLNLILSVNIFIPRLDKPLGIVRLMLEITR